MVAFICVGTETEKRETEEREKRENGFALFREMRAKPLKEKIEMTKRALLLFSERRAKPLKEKIAVPLYFRAQRPALFFSAQDFWAELFIPSLNELASVPSKPSTFNRDRI